MHLPKLQQDGFHVVGLALAIIVVGAVGFIGLKVFTAPPPFQGQTLENTPAGKDGGPPIWEYDQQQLAWGVKSGTAPACKEPVAFDTTPVDMTQVTAVGLPGAYRGYSYKAHGGFRLSNATAGYTQVRLPMDAKLMAVSRYYEHIPGKEYELQYILDFENDCGIAFRFDHIHTLTPVFQAYADKSPAPKKDDTTSSPTAPIRRLFKAGDVIATRVGFPLAQNYGFDFGVYDLRQPNTISKNAQWATIHVAFSAQHFHGVCWLPLLPGADAVKAEAIAKDRNNYNSSKLFNLTSDYCEFAPYKTLDFSDGQPTDG